ncbi:hypothetical protein SEA_WEASELS2_211 [Rhodococcus phage Weasels2]|uniref:Uncharacterized protein n=1 Tax=Rhodococcus phage Weasels2 TaxID=1897437 RepID=A0A1I9SAI3_9CAUD|nr:hypothetical protein FDH04_gp205 [Rhodococcus phage Weasels2]AOZ63789.1 hypothetical protein SEA_WEASELS2_211 [Rhodococcus phage Weasels2]
MPRFRVVKGPEYSPSVEIVEAIRYSIGEDGLNFLVKEGVVYDSTNYYRIKNWLEVGPDKR